MTTVQEVLLILVAFATLILLIFTIVAMVMILVVVKRIKIIVDRAKVGAENVAEIVEEVKESLGNPTNVARFVTRMVNRRHSSEQRRTRTDK